MVRCIEKFAVLRCGKLIGEGAVSGGGGCSRLGVVVPAVCFRPGAEQCGDVRSGGLG